MDALTKLLHLLAGVSEEDGAAPTSLPDVKGRRPTKRMTSAITPDDQRYVSPHESGGPHRYESFAHDPMFMAMETRGPLKPEYAGQEDDVWAAIKRQYKPMRSFLWKGKKERPVLDLDPALMQAILQAEMSKK